LTSSMSLGVPFEDQVANKCPSVGALSGLEVRSEDDADDDMASVVFIRCIVLYNNCGCRIADSEQTKRVCCALIRSCSILFRCARTGGQELKLGLKHHQTAYQLPNEHTIGVAMRTRTDQAY
jgi:hypothetical protein